jgi:hypothetical protein
MRQSLLWDWCRRGHDLGGRWKVEGRRWSRRRNEQKRGGRATIGGFGIEWNKFAAGLQEVFKANRMEFEL